MLRGKTRDVCSTAAHRLLLCDISLPRPSLCPLYRQAVSRPPVLLQGPLGIAHSSAVRLEQLWLRNYDTGNIS